MNDYYVVCKLFFGVYDVIQADNLTSEEADKLIDEFDCDAYTWFTKYNKKEDPEKYKELLTHDANKKYDI